MRFPRPTLILCLACACVAARAAEPMQVLVTMEGVTGEIAEKGFEGAILAEKLEYRLERSASKSFISKLGIEKRPHSLQFCKGRGPRHPGHRQTRRRRLEGPYRLDPRLRGPGGKRDKLVFSLTLRNVTVTSVDVFADEKSEGRPLETVSVDYESLELKSETGNTAYTLEK
ncbi:MAG: type VI secretion system tube protein Hcp [Planctomycetota bacterium]|nr:type VI secretion system tube protein Hcp [Planctomycetota bacterium]